ncbi:Intermediate cleaving peptidase 55 [Cytospora mali]|uniref:Xaa-Pro aminopeptidase n=1 Tax=Cytospora mali TaxID=578113 RepID=A0A194W177_CYTMA|nr:Intermediate cleaving peptidase 55 [Valsa mali]
MRIRPSTASSLATPCLLRTCTGSVSKALLPPITSRLSTSRATRLPTTRQYATTAVPASQLQFGQPVYETHPHILKPGEITPGITAQEYHDRRAALSRSLPRDAVAILQSADLKWRSGAVFHPFRQESNFLYLTGFSEPECLAVIQKTGDEPGDFLFHLLVRPKDPSAEQWSGPWSGVQAALDVFNADRAGDVAKAREVLAPVLKGASRVYTDVDIGKSGARTKMGDLILTATENKVAIDRLQPIMNQLRVIKSPAEIANMRHAGRVSGRALTDAMRQGWTRERDLQAYIEYGFTRDGCDGPAYVPVVAGGERANMIHYVLNNAELEGEELVLVDAGGEYGTYITDITRTWPVSGRFTPAQRDLYEAVLRVQRTGVSLCRASSGMTLDGIHRATEHALRNELSRLGFDMSGNNLEALFPHHVGHYVGLDVHDCPGYGRSVALKAGHCVTIEPGVYVPDDEKWPKHFRGMGIRIEDSVCVDDDSPLVLTTEAVKEVVDIEALRD